MGVQTWNIRCDRGWMRSRQPFAQSTKTKRECRRPVYIMRIGLRDGGLFVFPLCSPCGGTDACSTFQIASGCLRAPTFLPSSSSSTARNTFHPATPCRFVGEKRGAGGRVNISGGATVSSEGDRLVVSTLKEFCAFPGMPGIGRQRGHCLAIVLPVSLGRYRRLRVARYR